ncbi:MAG: 50S ribosomal protein L3 [Candidatus Aenigmarchaeota archaeon]|nr:50S ribosomal protein L3 [Candidatus Aenigmarchaeota archaeon]
MPEVKKPREGSKAYWPKKRTIRIYPNLATYPKTDKPKIMGFAGYKASMLHAIIFDNRKGSLTFGQEVSTPITVVDCPPLKVIGLRAYTNSVDGLKTLSEAVVKDLDKDFPRKIILGNFKTEERLADMEKRIDKISRIRLVMSTQPRLSGIGKKTPEIFELEVGGNNTKEMFDYAKGLLNKEVSAKDLFREGELIDVVSVTKGKGTQGPVKRFGVKIQNRHAKKKLRHVGSLGQERPGKVRSTAPMSGQMGFWRRTEFNKRLLKIGNGNDITPKGGFTSYGNVNNYILVQGSIPGSKKRLVMLRPAIRPSKIKFDLPEIREIVK